MEMDTQTFFDRVLPESGYYALGVKAGVVFTNRCYETKTALAKAVTKIDAGGYTVYHANASFADNTLPVNGGFRTKANVAMARCVTLDLDVEPNNPKRYPSKRAAALALGEFCTTLGMPDPMVVDSGGGLHVYWVFDRDVSREEVESAREHLAVATQQERFLCDTGVTKNSAGILRPIGTHWRKRGERVVRLLLDQTQAISYDAFMDRLAPFAPAPTSQPQDTEWSTGPHDYPPSSGRELIKHCPAMAEVAQLGGAVEEPLWRVMLGLLKHTTEGEALAHEWSQGDPRYSQAETQRKLDAWQGRAPTCASILNAGGSCDGCAHQGKITSPITLGYTLPSSETGSEPEPESDPIQDQDPLTQYAQQMPDSLPFWPDRFRWDGKFLSIAIRDENGVLEWVPFTTRYFYPFMRVRLEGGTWALRISSFKHSGAWEQFDIETKLVSDARTTKASLAAYEIFSFGRHGGEYMQAFLQDIISALDQRNIETHTIPAFGWTDQGFVLGNTLLSNGPDRPVILADRVPKNLHHGFNPCGTTEEWVDLIDTIYNRKGAEAYQFMICAGFAAPLVQLAASDLWHGIPIALTGESGLGKTTTSLVACSMFGAPNSFLLSAHKMGTTLNALIQRVAVMRNLPMVLDELHGMNGADLPMLLYALSNGVPKNTLNADRSFKDQGLSWNTLTFVTSNQNLMHLLGAHDRARAEATQVRIFEIPLPNNYNDLFGDINAKDLIENRLLSNQYGAVGRAFLKAVAGNRDGIAKLLHKARAKYIPDDSEATRERFFYDLTAFSITAGKLAQKLGFLNFDMKAVEDFALKNIEELRRTRSMVLSGYDDQIQQVFAALHDRTVHTKSFPRGAKRQVPEYVDPRSVRDPIARACADENVLAVTATGFRQVCMGLEIDARALIERAEREGWLYKHFWAGLGPHCKMHLFRGTSLPLAATATKVYLFNLAAMSESQTVGQTTVTPFQQPVSENSDGADNGETAEPDGGQQVQA